ncbi:MAG: hypothetical protein HQL13_06525 [Candidatus Omnitrophica bacterium]|nr:hypothetical protein [Candidatus Omnitrophota bacterium]
MNTLTLRKSPLFRAMAYMVLTAFIMMMPVHPALAQVAIVMPKPGTMVHVTKPFEPPQMIGLKVNLKDPFNFKFIMDQGEASMSDDIKRQEFNKIIKYFLVSLAMPNKDMWVNLSPYESHRIIPDVFGQTEMGRDLLAQDYMLKQFTASLMYPEEGLGKTFWDKVYAEAKAKFGTTDIKVNTFNKVWIVADKADVYQKGDSAFLIKSHLKVMLEQDYMALEKNKEMFGNLAHVDTSMDARAKMASDIVRQIIIPAIEKEVNTAKNFAPVRQVYGAEIMATWYKKALKQSLLGQVFANTSKVAEQKHNDPKVMANIYEQYLKAYRKGVFNYIKEDLSPNGQTIPRKYFSGGCQAMAAEDIRTILPRGSSPSQVAAAQPNAAVETDEDQQEAAVPAKKWSTKKKILVIGVAILAAYYIGIPAILWVGGKVGAFLGASTVPAAGSSAIASASATITPGVATTTAGVVSTPAAGASVMQLMTSYLTAAKAATLAAGKLVTAKAAAAKAAAAAALKLKGAAATAAATLKAKTAADVVTATKLATDAAAAKGVALAAWKAAALHPATSTATWVGNLAELKLLTVAGQTAYLKGFLAWAAKIGITPASSPAYWQWAAAKAAGLAIPAAAPVAATTTAAAATTTAAVAPAAVGLATWAKYALGTAIAAALVLLAKLRNRNKQLAEVKARLAAIEQENEGVRTQAQTEIERLQREKAAVDSRLGAVETQLQQLLGIQKNLPEPGVVSSPSQPQQGQPQTSPIPTPENVHQVDEVLTAEAQEARDEANEEGSSIVPPQSVDDQIISLRDKLRSIRAQINELRKNHGDKGDVQSLEEQFAAINHEFIDIVFSNILEPQQASSEVIRAFGGLLHQALDEGLKPDDPIKERVLYLIKKWGLNNQEMTESEMRELRGKLTEINNQKDTHIANFDFSKLPRRPTTVVPAPAPQQVAPEAPQPVAPPTPGEKPGEAGLQEHQQTSQPTSDDVKRAIAGLTLQLDLLRQANVRRVAQIVEAYDNGEQQGATKAAEAMFPDNKDENQRKLLTEQITTDKTKIGESQDSKNGYFSKLFADNTVEGQKQRHMEAVLADLDNHKDNPAIHSDQNKLKQHLAEYGGINLSKTEEVINIKVGDNGMPLPMNFQDKALQKLKGMSHVICSIQDATPKTLPELFAIAK